MQPGRAVVVAGGVALLATSFVPLWATYRVPGLGLVAPQTVHQNAWAAYGLTMQLALVLAAVSAVWAIAMRSPRATTVLLALCAVTTALLAWQIVRGPSGSHDPGGYGIDRGILLFTGGALAAAMTYGSYREWMKPPQRAPVGDDVPRARRPTSLGE